MTLGENVTFNNLHGRTLTLKSLFVDEITAGSILTGEDTLPDIYYFGQVPGTSIFGIAGQRGETADARAGQAVLFDATPAGTLQAQQDGSVSLPTNGQGLSANGSNLAGAGLAQAIITFPSKIHYTASSSGDALNPFISASMVTSGLVMPASNGNSTTVPSYPIAGTRTACVRPGIQALNPLIVVQQGADLVSATGAWFGLPIPTTTYNVAGTAPLQRVQYATATPPIDAYISQALVPNSYLGVRELFSIAPGNNYPAPLQMMWYVAGCEAQTPPAPWAIPSGITTALTTFVPYSGFAGGATPVTASKFTIAYPSGIAGTGITFPDFATQPLAFTTLDDSGGYPDVVYPVNSSTDPLYLVNNLTRNPNLDANGILAPPPYTKTGGIWIQQIWWVQTTPFNGIAPGGYNITHFFTKAGGNGISPVNPARLEVSARAAGAGNGSFTVNIYLPRTISTADALYSSKLPSSYRTTRNDLLPPNSTFPASPAYGYYIVYLCCSVAGTSSTTAIRCSDNTIPPSGQGGQAASPPPTGSTNPGANAGLLGQFSQYPLGFTNSQVAHVAPTGPGQPNNKPTPIGWTSTPIGPIPAPWYSAAPLIEGQYVLTPPT